MGQAVLGGQMCCHLPAGVKGKDGRSFMQSPTEGAVDRASASNKGVCTTNPQPTENKQKKVTKLMLFACYVEIISTGITAELFASVSE